MKKVISVVLFGLAVLTPSIAEADTVNMTLTGAGSNVMAGIYIGPYTAQINGESFKVICDDFLSDTYLNESWTANVSTFSDLSSTKFGASNASGYEDVAWLTLQLLDPSTTKAQAGAIQFAIWQVFTPTAFNWLSGSNRASAQSWLTLAQSQTFTPGQFSNVVIYTPTGSPATCSGRPCPTPIPQEFVAVRSVPEPGTLVLLGTGLVGAIAARRRR